MLIFCDFLNESCRKNFVAQGRNPCPREERKGKAKGEKKGETEVPSMETSGAGEAVISDIFRECHCRAVIFMSSKTLCSLIAKDFEKPSSAPVERLFSIASLVLTARQSRLIPPAIPIVLRSC